MAPQGGIGLGLGLGAPVGIRCVCVTEEEIRIRTALEGREDRATAGAAGGGGHQIHTDNKYTDYLSTAINLSPSLSLMKVVLRIRVFNFN